MSRIGPHDVLEDGTRIRCGKNHGHIVSHTVVDAVPSGKIVVHSCQFTEKWEGYPRRRMILLKVPITRDVNYSDIEVKD